MQGARKESKNRSEESQEQRENEAYDRWLESTGAESGALSVPDVVPSRVRHSSVGILEGTWVTLLSFPFLL